MLAQLGQVNEAQKEFEEAIRQSGGTFGEAEHNLKLCGSLGLSAANRGMVGELKIASLDVERIRQ